MTQQAGSSYVDTTDGSGADGYLTDAERFPDPKRNWKRTGSLLGGWVLTLVAVFVFGVVWHNFLSTVFKPDPADEPASGSNSASMFFTQVYEFQDVDKARALMCDGYKGPEPEDMIDELGNGEAAVDDIVYTSPIQIEISVYYVPELTTIKYEAEADEAGSSSCVESVERLSEE